MQQTGINKNIPILGQKLPKIWKFIDDIIGVALAHPLICPFCMPMRIITDLDILSVEMVEGYPSDMEYKISCGCTVCGSFQQFVISDTDLCHYQRVLKLRQDNNIGRIYVLDDENKPKRIEIMMEVGGEDATSTGKQK